MSFADEIRNHMAWFTAEAGAAVQGLMTTPAKVRRSTLASDGAGGVSNTWSEVATLNCYFTQQIRQPSDQIGAGINQPVSHYTASFPIGSDVRSTDRLEINGDIYEVIETDAGISHPLTLTAFLTRR